ncbi:MAG: preprotein translocase subunit SecE [Alistipes sp.]|nr:preprotein translocase subunit SecE [Alistipes sp.]
MVNYVKNSYNELVHKVTWPTVKELQSSAIVVMVASLIFALVILAMDVTFENLMKAIYNVLYKSTAK